MREKISVKNRNKQIEKKKEMIENYENLIQINGRIQGGINKL